MSEVFVSATEFFALVKMTESPYERRRVDMYVVVINILISRITTYTSPVSSLLQRTGIFGNSSSHKSEII